MYRNIESYSQKGEQHIWMSTWTEDGRRTIKMDVVKPHLYMENSFKKQKNDESDLLSMYGKVLDFFEFSTNKQRNEWIEKHKNINLFEKLSPAKQYLLNAFFGKEREQEFSRFPLKVYFFDIEVEIQDRFPDPADAAYPINIISIYDAMSKKVYAWAYKRDVFHAVTDDSIEKITKDVHEKYEAGVEIEIRRFTSERELLEDFLLFWSRDINEYPDILTGWNIDGFDIPYLINRLSKITPSKLNLLSPLHDILPNFCVKKPDRDASAGKKTERAPAKAARQEEQLEADEVEDSNSSANKYEDGFFGDMNEYATDDSKDKPVWRREETEKAEKSKFGSLDGQFGIMGISLCDYMKLHKKFILKSQQSYKLDYIAKMETGKGKLDYYDLGYESMREFMTKDFATFLEYNIIDSTLVKQIDDRRHFIDLMRRICNMGLCEYVSIFKSIPYILGGLCIEARHHGMRFLTDANRDQEHAFESTGYEGAFVFPTKPGFYKNGIVSFDFNSLYPNTIMSCNMSPETMVGKVITDIDDEADWVKIKDMKGNLLKLPKDKFNKLLETKCCISGNGVLFKKSTVQWGIIPSFLEKLYRGRVELKKKMKENKKLSHKLDEEIKQLEEELKKFD